jgi:hypothetical protein
MRRRPIRDRVSAAALVVVVVATLTLTSCTPLSTMRASIVGGQPAFAVCEDVISNGIWVSTLDTDVWYLFSLETPIEAGTIIVLGEPLDGFREDPAFDQRYLDDTLRYVNVYIRETRGSSYSGSFRLSDLAEGSWMGTEGRVHSEPC